MGWANHVIRQAQEEDAAQTFVDEDGMIRHFYAGRPLDEWGPILDGRRDAELRTIVLSVS